MAWVGPAAFDGDVDGWMPRGYQSEAWNQWVNEDCKHLELIWHRRSGKDELTLYGTCIKAHQRIANYWHMLPLQNQIRKAVWDAVNPHTGIRRIDEAFPLSCRESTRDNDMLIRFKNGSTWQCLGSDNFQNAIGSSPAGIVYSEWPQSNPSVRGYLRPILIENDGWQLYIGTPRGKNHGYKTYKAAKENPKAFAQILTANDTKTLKKDQLVEELDEYITTYGENMGKALYQQEYDCSFDAAILGAFYQSEFAAMDRQGRICDVPHDINYPVSCVMDIGRTDDTAIYFYQVIGGEVRVLDYLSNNGKDVAYYCSQILGIELEIDVVENKLIVRKGPPIEGLKHRRQYNYKTINLPHDAKSQTLAAVKTTMEQFIAVFGWGKVAIVPKLSIDNGIKMARQMFPRLFINKTIDTGETQNGVEPLRQYRREWDDTKKMFNDKPLHDWCSHAADAFRYLAVAYTESPILENDESPKFDVQGDFKHMMKIVKTRRIGENT